MPRPTKESTKEEWDKYYEETFYSNGTTRVERHTLVKDGFHPIKIRKILGDWESLAYENPHTGDTRWEKINLKLFPEEVILEHIELYEKIES